MSFGTRDSGRTGDLVSPEGEVSARKMPPSPDAVHPLTHPELPSPHPPLTPSPCTHRRARLPPLPTMRWCPSCSIRGLTSSQGFSGGGRGCQSPQSGFALWRPGPAPHGCLSHLDVPDLGGWTVHCGPGWAFPLPVREMLGPVWSLSLSPTHLTSHSMAGAVRDGPHTSHPLLAHP